MTARTRARKKRTIVEEEIPDGVSGLDEPLNDLDVTLESVQDTEALKDALEQFGITEGILYRIYRSVPTGPPSFCYESTEFSETFLQRERGAGSYVVRIFINGKYKKSINTQVDAPAPGTGPAQNPADSHSQFLEKLLMALLMKDKDPAPAGPSLLDMTQALNNLDNMRGKQENAMDIFLKGVTLAKEIMGESGGAGDWKSELLKMGRDAIPAITSVVQARTQPTPIIQPDPNAVDKPMIDPEQLTEDQQKQVLKHAITYLKGQFITGLDPESALNFIIANSGNPQYQAIIKAVLKFTFDDIVGLDNELQQEPFHGCFRFIFDGLRSNFGPDDTLEDDSGGTVGDSVDTGNNGGTSKARK